MIIPRATARLQSDKHFTFDDAVAVVDYYATLGISHRHASSMLAARSGSTHGYDIVDPTRINPELGGEEGLRRLAACLRQPGMGLIADIVPNHMGAGSENPWWQHVPEHGHESPYAGWFDIGWDTPDAALSGKVLAPFLGQAYGDALSAGELKLQFDESNGKVYLGYYAHCFPLSIASYAHMLSAAGSPRLEPVITEFELIRLDDVDAVRHASAQAAFLLLREIGSTLEGAADIDAALTRFSSAAPDGLDAPHQLLERQHYRLTWWRNAADEINRRRFFAASDLAGVRVEQDDVFEATHALIFRMYAQGLIDDVRIDHVDGLADPGAHCRKLRQRLTELMMRRPSDLRNLRMRDVSLPAIRRVLTELLVHFSVYRTYAREDGRNVLDQQAFDRPVDRVRQTPCSADRPLLPVTGRWLGADAPNRFEGSDTKDLCLRAITRFQRLTPPLAAKSVEDTAFYRYGRLVSRNEVGVDPTRFSISVQGFHVANVARAALSEYLACDCHARSQARRRCPGSNCSTERRACVDGGRRTDAVPDAGRRMAVRPGQKKSG